MVVQTTRDAKLSLFDGLSTHVGPLSAPHRRRLRRLLLNPTPEAWDDAYVLLLRSEPGLWLLLWQAVKAVAFCFVLRELLRGRLQRAGDHEPVLLNTRGRPRAT